MNKNSLITPAHNKVHYLEHLVENCDKVLFFIHGFPDSPNVWHNQFEYFKGQYNLIAPYAPGIISESDSSLSEICRNYISIIKKYDFKEVILISHDLGGPIACEMIDQITVIKKGIFINAPSLEQMFFRLKDLKQLKKSWYIFLFQAQGISKYLIAKTWNQIEKKIKANNNLNENIKLDKEICLATIHLYKNFFKHLTTFNSKLLKKTKTHCDFLWSKYDPYLNIPTVNELNLLFESYSLEILDLHHWPMIEEAQTINYKIEELL